MPEIRQLFESTFNTSFDDSGMILAPKTYPKSRLQGWFFLLGFEEAESMILNDPPFSEKTCTGGKRKARFFLISAIVLYDPALF